jgi:hypothetical protein
LVARHLETAQQGQCTQEDDDQECSPRIATKPPAVGSGADADGQQHQENREPARENSVDQVAEGPHGLRGIPGEGRRGQVGQPECEQQDGRDAQRSVAAGGDPDPQRENDLQQGVKSD